MGKPRATTNALHVLSSMFARAVTSGLCRQALRPAAAIPRAVPAFRAQPAFTPFQILLLQGVDPVRFAAFNVLEDAELRAGIKEYSDWPTIPQLYVDGEFVGGCDILVSMHQNGDLAKMFEEKKV